MHQPSREAGPSNLEENLTVPESSLAAQKEDQYAEPLPILVADDPNRSDVSTESGLTIPSRDTWQSVGSFPVTEPPDPIFLLCRAAREQIWLEAREGLIPQVSEIGGMFMGQVYEEGQQLYVVARVAVPAKGGIGSAGSFKFTSDAMSHILDVQDRNFPELRIVGWYHSHPGYGIFLSKEWDQFICEQWFSRDDQITLVVDPVAGHEGIFIRRVGVLIANDPFGYQVFDENGESGGKK